MAESIYILLDVLLCCIAEYFYELLRYFDEPEGRVKIQTTSKNSQQYYTTKRLIRDLLSNTPNFYVRAGEFRRYLFTGNGDRSMRSGTELVNSRRTRQTGFRGFDHAITGAIYFTFHNGKKIVFRSPKLKINSNFSL